MKRLIIYFLVVLAFAGVVVWKMGVIKEKQAATVVSILGEWQRDGVPVEAFEVARQDLVQKEKLTGEVRTPHRLEAAVSASLARMLESGRPALVNEGEETLQASVLRVARSAGPTGLYQVILQMEAPVSSAPGSSLAVDVEVSRLRSVLAVPATSLQTEGDQSFVWKLVDGAAEKTEVQVGPASQGLVQITRGLQEGDLVVARGQANIESDLGVEVIGTL